MEHSEDQFNPQKRLVMATLLDICRKLRGGRYHVKRGGVNWATWDFKAHPYGLAVMADESSFLRAENNEMAVTLEFMTALPDDADLIDDGLMEELHSDAAAAFVRLDASRREDDPAFPVITMLDAQRDTALEVSSADDKVQGLLATAFVKY